MDIVKEHWKLYLFEGIVFLIIGFLAIAMPGVFSISFELVIGSLMLIGGLVQLYRSFKAHRHHGFVASAFGSVVFIIVGLLLLAFPLKGIMAITTLITICFLIDGCFRMLLAVQMRMHQPWLWYMFMGIIEVVIAVLIWNEWPSSALWVIGTLVGINLVFLGMTQIMVSLQARKS